MKVIDFWKDKEARIERVPMSFPQGIELFIKREDELDSRISGNKFRKMKYNLIKAEQLGVKTILTFGGAFSNHIAATAEAGRLLNFRTIGVIRGEELSTQQELNPTLSLAALCGMQFHWVSRQQYRERHTQECEALLKKRYGEDVFIIPEGGTNEEAVRGCEEVLSDQTRSFDVIALAVGTGGTLSGVSRAAASHQLVYGFPALRGDFLREEIRKFTTRSNWQLCMDYHFGGYGKVSDALVDFLNAFYTETGIPLDPIYTGKMMWGLLDLIKKHHFPENTKILAIHTGGLQGIKGFNFMRKQKNKTILHYE